MTDIVHTHGGNCWCHDCCFPHEDRPYPLDVCLAHHEPRGECIECKPCKVCEDADTRMP